MAIPDTLTARAGHPRLAAVPVFTDNYVWILAAASGPACVLVDPGDAGPVCTWLEAHGRIPVAVLVTHHHADHTAGIAGLKARYPGLRVHGPRREAIPGVDATAGDGDRLTLPEPGLAFEVLDVPGHTAGHIAWLCQLDDGPLLFCGDTLFSAGCGRLFEGTPAQMHASLQRLAALPDTTRICCTHEYTAANLRFAAAVEPDNPDIARCARWVETCRAAGEPSLPGTLARERRVNPYLRLDQPGVIAAAAAREGPLADPGAVFAALRRWKDGFR